MINRRKFLKRGGAVATASLVVGGVALATPKKTEAEKLRELASHAWEHPSGDEGLKRFNRVRGYPVQTLEGLAEKVEFAKRDFWKQPDYIYADILRLAGAA